MKKVKDTDFLHISPRIKMLEMKLLTKEDINRMITSTSDEDAAKIPMDRGYKAFDSGDIASLEQSLENEERTMFEFLEPHMPNEFILDFFKVKNDYHNIKAILKADALGVNVTPMLSRNGIYSYKEIRDIVRDGAFDGVYEGMEKCIIDAREVLAKTRDPQISDIRIDMAMYEHMAHIAKKAGSDFLTGYMRLMIDADNLRAAVRVKRMKKNSEFLEKVIADGGNIPKKSFLTGELSLETIYKDSPLEQAAKLGEEVSQGRSRFAPLDIMADNCLMEYARGAKLISFGDKTVLGYIIAKEREINQIRTVMVGRLSKRPAEKISESLRLNYV